MSNKIFLITLALALALVAIGLSSGWGFPWGFPDTADDAYRYASAAVMAKCGTNIQFLGILVENDVARYAFTPGTCHGHFVMTPGLPGISEYVVISYDLNAHSLGEPEVQNLRIANYDYGFGTDYTKPISLPDWKVSSGEVFQIISAHGGPNNPKDFLGSGGSGGLLLYQGGDSLQWEYVYQVGSVGSQFRINATTGQVIRSSSGALPLP
jgi:hypothetical protein